MVVNSKTYVLKDGRQLYIRCPLVTDAKKLLDTYKTACGESRNLSRDISEFNITIEKEEMFIKSIDKSPRHIMLMAFVDGEHAGNADIAQKSELSRDRHRCTLGIALVNKFTGLGIGTILITELIEIAKSLGYEQMELIVVSHNIKAKKLYERLGFNQVGIIPHGQKYSDGSYADLIHMVKFLV